MTVSNRHILEQGPALAGLGRIALSVIGQRVRGQQPRSAPQVPGKMLELTLPPRSRQLIRDYVINVGGDPSAYGNTLPLHFYPQWCFGLGTSTFIGAPYPLSKMLNAGTTVEVQKPVPADEPLSVRAQFVNLDDDGRRAVLTARVVTSTPSAPDALIADMNFLVPLKRDKGATGDGTKKEQPSVPVDAKLLTSFEVSADGGLDFAKLTGDFNPIHWLKPAARASGFPNVILHGFGTMARAIEGLNRTQFGGDVTRIKKWTCRFTKPLVLPAHASLFVRSNDVFVGAAAGGPAYLVGSFEA